MKSSNSSGVYIFFPNYADYNGLFLIITISFGTVGFAGNVFIQVLMRKISNNMKYLSSSQRTFGRPYLFRYFLQSLTISDILCSIFVSSVLSFQLVYEVGNSLWLCKMARFLLYIFPMVTINNLLVISVERYYAIFYPFRIPASHVIKTVVILAWLVGIMNAIGMTVLVLPVQVKLDNTFWTYACVPSPNKTVWKKMLFICISLVQYYIPTLILVYVSCSIARFLHKRQSAIEAGKLRYINNSVAWRYFGTKMFLKVFLAFFLPYSLFFCYFLIKFLVKFNLDHNNDSVIRYTSAFLALLNSSINPFIYSRNSNLFKSNMKRIFEKFPCFRDRTENKSAAFASSEPTASHSKLSSTTAVGLKDIKIMTLAD